MRTFDITGMGCAACAARIEKAVSKMENVSDVNVNLLLNEMTLEGTATDEDIIAVVEKAGYGATVRGNSASAETPETVQANTPEDAPKNTPEDALNNTPEKTSEFSGLLRRFIVSLVLLIPLFYLGMGRQLWNFPVPEFMNSVLCIGSLECVLSLAIIIINRSFFLRGLKGLLHGAPNMDTLISFGAGISFAYSLFLLIYGFLNPLTAGAGTGDKILLWNGTQSMFYFESAGMILTIITLGKMLEAFSKGKTTSAIEGLKKMAPSEAVVLRNGVEEKIPSENLRVNDLFVVFPGASFPCDGVITEGNSSVNESSLTGESMPVDKAVGDAVSSGTVNLQGHLICRATKVGSDTLLSQIIKTVEEANGRKAPIQRIADKASLIFVPAVMGIALLTFIIWLITSSDFVLALTRGVSVLVVSCPCALGLATPLAIMVGSGIAAKSGILFKTAEALEKTGKIKKIFFDKTGTITEGAPKVQTYLLNGKVTPTAFFTVAYALEAKSEHPLSKAILDYFKKEVSFRFRDTAKDFEIIPGKGLKGSLLNLKIYGGNEKYIREVQPVPEEFEEKIAPYLSQGMTPLYFATSDDFLGAFLVSDVLKPDAESTISHLKSMGLSLSLLSGDRNEVVRRIAEKVGIQEYHGGLLPADKAGFVSEDSMMIGDGINDAPSLEKATIGVSVYNGNDLAMDSADLVLLREDLSLIGKAFRISKATRKTIIENLFWAVFYNLLLIPLSSGLLSSFIDFQMSPMLSALAMSLSSVTVCLNALRLNLKKFD